MPGTDTHSNVLSPPTRTVPTPDSPPARGATRTRAREATHPPRDRAPRQARTRPAQTSRRALARWWGWTARPVSLRAMWRLSAVNRTRVPLASGPLTLVWRLSNGTDRLLMFALTLLAPTGLTGPLRWLATRPTRRFGFYLLTAAAVAVFRLH